MKIYIRYFLPLLICCILFACQKEKEEILVEEEKYTSHQTNESGRSPNSDDVQSSGAGHRTNEESLTKAQVFERRMQWTSFISAQVLRIDEDAQGEVLSLLDEGASSVPLEDLIGEVELTPDFKTSFMNKLYDYILLIYQNGKPEHGVDVLPPPCCGPDSLDVQDFLKYMIEDNCVELYFPKLLNFGIPYTLTSTAHPLTTLPSNYGYLRYYEPIAITPGGDSLATAVVTVNPDYIDENGNIVVARPFRTIICTYDEYDVPDFTDFLSN